MIPTINSPRALQTKKRALTSICDGDSRSLGGGGGLRLTLIFGPRSRCTHATGDGFVVIKGRTLPIKVHTIALRWYGSTSMQRSLCVFCLEQSLVELPRSGRMMSGFKKERYVLMTSIEVKLKKNVFQ